MDQVVVAKAGPGPVAVVRRLQPVVVVKKVWEKHRICPAAQTSHPVSAAEMRFRNNAIVCDTYDLLFDY